VKYFIASDHAGVDLKAFVKELLENRGFSVDDLGPYSKDRVDYPDFASKVCESVLSNENSNGILICGTGIGMSMMANKYNGIRAALCTDAYTAGVTKEHNDANVLCIGERVVGLGVVESIIEAWTTHSFEGGRHQGRVDKINNLMGSCRV
jgi:ribose 5-phosphate isomerase B